MATEMEFVNYKEFVAGLPETENPTATDKQVVCNETDGPRATPGAANGLSEEATEADLAAGNYIEVLVNGKKKKLHAEDVAKRSVQDKLVTDFAPLFVPNSTTTVEGQAYMYNGSLYVAKEAYQGAWDASKFTAVNFNSFLTSKMSMAELTAYSYFGYFPSLSGGGIVIAYRSNGGIAGFVTVAKNYASGAVVTNYGNNSCPLKFYFDGTRVLVQNSYNNVDVNLVVGTSSFVKSSYLPAGWDSGNAEQISVVNMPTPSSVENSIAMDRRFAALQGNANYGYMASGNGGLVIAYRVAAEGTGLILFEKYSSTLSVLHVSNNLTCPLKFYFDGTRVLVQNRYNNADINLIASNSNFVKSSTPPTGWDADHAVLTDVINIKPIDLTNYATKTFVDNEIVSNRKVAVVSANSVYGYVASGSAAAVIAYRVANAGTGLILLEKYSTNIKVVNVSNNIECPFKFLFDGTRLVVQNRYNNADVNLVVGSTNFVLSSSLPAGWDADHATQLNVVAFSPVDLSNMQDNVDETLDLSLVNACARINVVADNSKDFSVLIVTDSHADNNSVSRAISLGGKSAATSAIVHCGDFVAGYLENSETSTPWAGFVSASEKATYFVQGNHEKGNFPNVSITPSDETLYTLFVKPIVDKGYLENGEYEVNKCYYYHDFTDTKTRLLVIDEYRAPKDYDETYWRAIAYDSNISEIVDNTEYSVGDKINMPDFTANSFECVQNLNSGIYNSGYQPRYKCVIGNRYIDQTEAQWILDTLYSTPSDYSVLVAMHNPFSDLAEPYRESKFSQPNIPEGITGNSWSQNYMATDFIADALNAFVNASNISSTVSTKSGSDAAYLSDYTVSKDFSQRSAGKISAIIGGHVHRDVVWRHPTYTELIQVTPMCSITTSNYNNQNCDIRLQNDYRYTKYTSSYTSVSAADSRIALCKIGCKATIEGLIRDIDVINTAE